MYPLDLIQPLQWQKEQVYHGEAAVGQAAKQHHFCLYIFHPKCKQLRQILAGKTERYKTGAKSSKRY